MRLAGGPFPNRGPQPIIPALAGACPDLVGHSVSRALRVLRRPTEKGSHMRLLIVLGWLLALPGLWIILSFVLQNPVLDFAGCPYPRGFNRPACPPGFWGGLAEAMSATVGWTGLLLFIAGIGALPSLYSVLWVAFRAAKAIWRDPAQ